MAAEIQHFFDPQSSTLTYVVFDSATGDAVVIDPVWDFDAASGKFSTAAFNAVLNFLQDGKLKPHFVLETHAHADHISSSQLFKKYFPEIQVVISERISEVQKAFAPLYNFSENEKSERSFDIFVKDQSSLKAGSLNIQVIATPGHTPACVSYLIGDALFTGDALFMPDSGSGRCDFPGGSAETLYHSVTEKIFKLPDNTRLFVGHDYQPQGRELKYFATVAEQKTENIHLKTGTTLASFVEFRQKRDATLAAPKLLLPAMQVNIKAGHLPKAENNQKTYLKIPLSF
jgi:glyoxylase-like metal-dependent hydrolase (beta-lactamase superfamily II)